MSPGEGSRRNCWNRLCSCSSGDLSVCLNSPDWLVIAQSICSRSCHSVEAVASVVFAVGLLEESVEPAATDLMTASSPDEE